MSGQVAKAGPEDPTLADIAVPVLLLHGMQDMFVSPGHGEWLAKHLTAAAQPKSRRRLPRQRMPPSEPVNTRPGG